ALRCGGRGGGGGRGRRQQGGARARTGEPGDAPVGVAGLAHGRRQRAQRLRERPAARKGRGTRRKRGKRRRSTDCWNLRQLDDYGATSLGPLSMATRAPEGDETAFR